MVSCWRSCPANWTLRRCAFLLSMPEGLWIRLRASPEVFVR